MKAKLGDDRQPVARANETWAMDFVHDQLATGRKLRVLTNIDTFSRFCLVLDARFSYRGEDVVATLERTCGVTATRTRSASTRAASSCRANWTSGPTRKE